MRFILRAELADRLFQRPRIEAQQPYDPISVQGDDAGCAVATAEVAQEPGVHPPCEAKLALKVRPLGQFRQPRQGNRAAVQADGQHKGLVHPSVLDHRFSPVV